jgi:hypothetical protein
MALRKTETGVILGSILSETGFEASLGEQLKSCGEWSG